jgi:FkbM family methyltransferase
MKFVRRRRMLEVASWLEANALLRVTRRLARYHGSKLVGVPLYWCNRGLGRLVGDDAIRFAQVQGYSIAMPIGDADLRRSYLLGCYEPDVEALGAAVLRPGDLAVDVGANLGWHTLRFASTVGAAGHVFSFEPGEKPRMLLQQSIRANNWMDRVTASDEALSDHIGTANLYVDGAVGLMSSIHALEWLETSHATSVPVSTLDAGLLPRIQRAPRLLKIDVEGAEREVLSGGGRLFREIPPEVVILEISSISDGRPVLDLMNTYGYDPVELVDGRLQPRLLEPPEVSGAGPGAAAFDYFNVFFRHRSTIRSFASVPIG